MFMTFRHPPSQQRAVRGHLLSFQRNLIKLPKTLFWDPLIIYSADGGALFWKSSFKVSCTIILTLPFVFLSPSVFLPCPLSLKLFLSSPKFLFDSVTLIRDDAALRRGNLPLLRSRWGIAVVKFMKILFPASVLPLIRSISLFLSLSPTYPSLSLLP